MKKLRSWGVKTEKDIYLDTQKMLQDFFIETKSRGNKKWERDKPEVSYDFNDTDLKSKGQSYLDMMKDLKNE